MFSGIGSPEKALTNLNIDYELINYCEIDKHASKTYSIIHNIDESLNLWDVTKINPDILPKSDLLIHGSPCQNFSVIGTKEGGDKGSGTKSSLMWNSVDIIKELKPKYVIWENVKAVTSPNNKHNLDLYIKELEEVGYYSTYKVLNSLDFNVAQNRERLFVVSILDESENDFEFPNTIPLTRSLKDYIDSIVDKKYIVPHHCMIGMKSKKSIFRKRFRLRDLDEYAYCLTGKSGRAVITNNYIFNDLSMYDNKPCDNRDLDYLTDNKIPVRALTPREYWRLQHFDDLDFNKVDGIISDAQLYKQAGNSITVTVMEEIFKQLFKIKL